MGRIYESFLLIPRYDGCLKKKHLYNWFELQAELVAFFHGTPFFLERTTDKL